MKGALGFTAFVGLSLAVHAGAFWVMPEGGTEGQGAGGADIVTLVGSPASYAALVDAWDRPPETSPIPTMTPPGVSPESSEISPEAAVSRLPLPRIQPAGTEAPPAADTAAAPTVPTPDLVANVPGFAAPVVGQDAAAPQSVARPTLPRMAVPIPAQPDISAMPSTDLTPHFEGSTDLAAVTSPRPPVRPEGLAPPPPPAPTAQPAPSRPSPQQPAAPASTPTPDRTASGSGSGETQGASPTPTPEPGLSPSQIQSLVAQWGGQIQARIARSRPNVGAAGRAVVQLSVAPNGRLVGLGIARSSGNSAVDQAALSAVQRAGRFPRAPSGLSDASYTFSVPLTFQ